MTRLGATLATDVRLQVRHGLYAVGAVVSVLLGLLARTVPDLGEGALARVVPSVVVLSLLTTCFYFAAALVLLEKGDGSLAALAVTPLGVGEYLTSKVVTLTALATVETLAILAMATWVEIGDVAAVVAGTTAAGGVLGLSGLLAATRFDSVTSFIVPSGLVVVVLLLPLAAVVAGWDSPVVLAHPLGPPLTVIRAAYAPMPPGLVAGALLAGAAWLAVLGRGAAHRFARFSVRSE